MDGIKQELNASIETNIIYIKLLPSIPYFNQMTLWAI